MVVGDQIVHYRLCSFGWTNWRLTGTGGTSGVYYTEVHALAEVQLYYVAQDMQIVRSMKVSVEYGWRTDPNEIDDSSDNFFVLAKKIIWDINLWAIVCW